MFQSTANEVLNLKYKTTKALATDEQIDDTKTTANESVLAVLFRNTSCSARFGEINR